MLETREIIHRLRQGHTKRGIEKDLAVHRTITRKIYNQAIAHQWLDLQNPMPSDEEISKHLKPHEKKPKQHILDPYQEQLKAWHKSGNTAVVIQRLLEDKCPCDVQAIRRYLHKHFPKQPEPVMVRSTIPGEHIELDFGFLCDCLDDEGNTRKAQLFSFRLRHSRTAYRQIVLNQKTETFLLGHIHAFEHFGGVAAIAVLDNTKAAVLVSTRDNDRIRRSYQELAEHYGFIISPCLPRTPEHKGGVEGDVKYVKNNFLPYCREKLKEKNIEIPTYQYLAEELAKWGKEVADLHIVHGVGRSPKDLFESEEKRALRPLPLTRWDPTTWNETTVRKEWRILCDCAYYSVPYQLIGKKVQICTTATLVRIFYDNQEMACHGKAKIKWEFVRKKEHAPPLHEEVLQCNRPGLLLQAEKNGPFTQQLAEAILSHPSVDKLHPVRLLLKLGIKYSPERLERACERACSYKLHSYRSVKDILEKKLDQEPPLIPKETPVISYRFARDASIYSAGGDLSRHGNAMAGPWRSEMADSVIDDYEFTEQ